MENQNQNINAAFLPNPFSNRKKGIKDVNKNKGKIIKVLVAIAFVITCIVLIVQIIQDKSEISEANDDIETLQEEIDGIKTTNQGWQKNLDDAKKELKTVLAKQEELRNKYNDLSITLREMRRTGQTSVNIDEFNRINSQLADIKDEVSDKEKEVKLEKERLDNVKYQLSKKKEKYNSLVDQYNSLIGGGTTPGGNDPIIPQPHPGQVNIEFDSKILPSVNYLSNICQVLNIKTQITTRLMYRATRDGFNPITMHSKIDGIYNVMTIISSTEGKIYGGYSYEPFGGQIVGFKSDRTARIFNLSTGKLYLVSSVDEAIYNDPKYFVVYGKGDFFITNDGKLTTTFPQSYGLGTENRYAFLEGREYVTISEIEIFQIVPLAA